MDRRFRHPRLVLLDNRGYLAEASAYARVARSEKLRAPAEATAANRIAIAFEQIVRAALAQAVPLSDNRVLAYEQADRGFGYARRHRELDAISITDIVTVFEIKATRSETSALRGTGQLRKTGAILRSGTLGRTRGIALVLIWIDTSSSPPEIADWLSVDSPHNLHIPVDAETERVCLVRVSASDVWAWRRRLGVTVEESLWEEHEAEAALAERRRALVEAGVQPSDWPADLRETRATTIHWGAQDETSQEDLPMATALRQALGRPDR